MFFLFLVLVFGLFVLKIYNNIFFVIYFFGFSGLGFGLDLFVFWLGFSSSILFLSRPARCFIATLPWRSWWRGTTM